MARPLEGIRVIDLTMWLLGPFATGFMSTLGADVIKVEDSVHGDPVRGVVTDKLIPICPYPDMQWEVEFLHRNKRSLGIDLRKQPEASEVICKLAENADVFVSTLRRSTLEKWGLDYKSLSKHNHRLIYAHCSTYGPRGPDRDREGFDLTAKARSGIASTVGLDDGEQGLTPYTHSDVTGGIILATSVLAALAAREKQGVGQEVVTSMLGADIFLNSILLQSAIASGIQPVKYNRSNIHSPLFNTYKCRDKKWLALAMLHTDPYWSGFCKAINMPDLEKDPRFDSQIKRMDCDELTQVLEKQFVTQDRDYWMKQLKSAGVICEAFQNCLEVAEDPQVLANDYIVTVDHPDLGHIREVGVPIYFSKTPWKITANAPEVGQHTEEVLLEVGFTWEQLGNLKNKGVIM